MSAAASRRPRSAFLARLDALGRSLEKLSPFWRDYERARVLREAGPDAPWAELARVQGRRPSYAERLAEAARMAAPGRSDPRPEARPGAGPVTGFSR